MRLKRAVKNYLCRTTSPAEWETRVRNVLRWLRDNSHSLRFESRTKSRRSDWRAAKVKNQPIRATNALRSGYGGVARGERRVVLKVACVSVRTFTRFRGIRRLSLSREDKVLRSERVTTTNESREAVCLMVFMLARRRYMYATVRTQT